MRPRIDWRFKVDFEDNLDLLSEMDMHRYRLQRRLIGRVYRTANVLRHEQALDRALGDVVGRLTSIKGVEIDLTEWMHIIAVESLGAVVLSWSPGMIKAGTDRDTSNQSYLGWRRKSVFGLFPLITKLEVNYKWIGRIFGTLWGITYQTPKGFKPFFPVRQLHASLPSQPVAITHAYQGDDRKSREKWLDGLRTPRTQPPARGKISSQI